MANEQPQPSDMGAIVEAMKGYFGMEMLNPKAVDDEGNEWDSPCVVLPKEKRVESLKPFLDQFRALPERKKGQSTLTTVEAFSDYVNRHKTEQSVVYLDDRNPSDIALRAVFNPHGAQDAETGWGDFGAVYKFPLSDEWKAWTSIPDTFEQFQFATFLEGRIADVIDPAIAGERTKAFAADLGVVLAGRARLMELSRGLSVSADQRASQAINVSSGEGHLTFVEEHKDAAGAPLKVPGGFAIAIPVFRLGPLYQIAVRLRYRLQSGRVTWSLAPHGIDKVLEHAIAEAGERVNTATDVRVFRGGPG